MGIFEQLAWLTKKVKALCCIVEKNNSGCADCPVTTDGTTITGNGTVANPLTAVAPTPPYTTLVLGNVTQTGTNNPTFTIFQNTTGVPNTDISVSRFTAGSYSIQSASGTPFTNGKTSIILSSVDALGNTTWTYIQLSETLINFYSQNSSGVSVDGRWLNGTIEIKMYP